MAEHTSAVQNYPIRFNKTLQYNRTLCTEPRPSKTSQSSSELLVVTEVTPNLYMMSPKHSPIHFLREVQV